MKREDYVSDHRTERITTFKSQFLTVWLCVICGLLLVHGTQLGVEAKAFDL
jgi:hypothetical protein